MKLSIKAKCSRTRARCGYLLIDESPGLSHEVLLPCFMPVGTNASLKGLLPCQTSDIGYRLILANTYHLALKCSDGLLDLFKQRGCAEMMNWPHALLTDSGGFQMVSLSELMSVNDEGVKFKSPFCEKEIFLTPEESINTQQLKIGTNIIMQLDDVVPSLTTGDRLKQATFRSLDWLKRCNKSWKNNKQLLPHGGKGHLFPIVQGGLDKDLREKSAKSIVELYDCPGYAIGGLSGGEEKSKFCDMVFTSTSILPTDKPRYVMGLGYLIDQIMAIALGADMFDCVFPTRTA
ncbi:MAG: Queuine tRNA-ribosyltransferase catalytic subunit 1, partial [Paramarteilia canceri]